MEYIGIHPSGHWELTAEEGISIAVYNADVDTERSSPNVRILTKEELDGILAEQKDGEEIEKELDGWARQDSYNQTGKL